MELHTSLAAVVGAEEAWTILSWETGIPVPKLKLLGSGSAIKHQEVLLEVARRRAEGEPLAYAFGWAPFCDRRFHVSPDVLIPRQETEELVQHALQFAAEDVVLIDCGTGSGCIPITCALEGAWRTVRGCDISFEALDIAEWNAEELGAPVGFHMFDVTSDRWRDWLREVAGSSPCVLTANLPYIPSSGMATLDADVQQEPALALDGGLHGTAIIKAWLAQVKKADVQARLLLELDADNKEDLDAYCAAEGWQITWRQDAAGSLRFCDIQAPDSFRG